MILMLGDTRSAALQLSKIVGAANCLAYNDLVLDEIMDGNRDRNWFAGELRNIRKGLGLLESTESQKVYANVLCNRIAPHLSSQSYEEMCVLPQYFYEHEGYRLDPDEVLVDCGAHTGDTLEEFLKISEIGGLSKAYAFGMDKNNFAALNAWIHGQGNGVSEKITTYNAGVRNENGTLSYGKMASSDSFSIYNPRETVTAGAVRLDDVLGDKRITLLKKALKKARWKAHKT